VKGAAVTASERIHGLPETRNAALVERGDAAEREYIPDQARCGTMRAGRMVELELGAVA